MATLERAIAIAASAHTGQVDKAGLPYILHPLRVMLAVATTDERIVAVLHDVVEDTPWTLDQLRAEGFSPAVLAGLDAVTRRDGETYEEFVLRAARDPIGREVKRADLVDNLDLGRIAEPTERDRQRVAKYRHALEILDEKPAHGDDDPPVRSESRDAMPAPAMQSEASTTTAPRNPTAKEQARALVELLPDDASWEDLQYEIYVLQKVEAGLAAVEAGDVVSHTEVKRRFGVD